MRILNKNNGEDTCISDIKSHMLIDVRGVILPPKNPEDGSTVSCLNMSFLQNGYRNMLYVYIFFLFILHAESKEA